MRSTTTIHRVWRASGAGRPTGDGGILEVTRERWQGRRRTLEKQWDLYEWEPVITAIGGGRVALDYGRFSPVRMVLRERLPGTHRRREFWHDVGRTTSRRLPRDADGCSGTQTRETIAGGSIEHLSS